MKKFAKGCLITALSMLIIGFVILAICIFVGGTSIYTYAKNNADIYDIFHKDVVTLRNDETHIVFSDDYPVYSGNHKDLQAALSSEVNCLDLEIGGGGCIISESSDEYFHISSKNAQSFQYYTENGTLFVKGFDKFSLGVHEEDYNYIYLEIPKNMTFEKINLEIGAGIIKAHSFSAHQTINIEVGAGELIADSLSSDSIFMDVGAGNGELRNASCNDATIHIGLGNVTYSGIIAGNLIGECGLGNIDFYLDDNYATHNYNIECSLGNITIDNRNYSGLDHSNNIQNHADSTYTLECDMGNITIDFN